MAGVFHRYTTETEIVSFLWISKFQLPVWPAMETSSKWRVFFLFGHEDQSTTQCLLMKQLPIYLRLYIDKSGSGLTSVIDDRSWSDKEDVIWMRLRPFGSPDNKVCVAHMGPTWVLSAPGGPHVGPMNLTIRVMSQPIIPNATRRYIRIFTLMAIIYFCYY